MREPPVQSGWFLATLEAPDGLAAEPVWFPTCVDGIHDTRERAEKALGTMRQIRDEGIAGVAVPGFGDVDAKRWIVVRVEFYEPRSKP